MALRLAAAFANDGADESPGSAMKNFIKGKTAALSEAVTPAISGATASISAAVTPAPGPGMSLAEIIDEVRTLRADNVQLREEREVLLQQVSRDQGYGHGELPPTPITVAPSTPAPTSNRGSPAAGAFDSLRSELAANLPASAAATPAGGGANMEQPLLEARARAVTLERALALQRALLGAELRAAENALAAESARAAAEVEPLRARCDEQAVLLEEQAEFAMQAQRSARASARQQAAAACAALEEQVSELQDEIARRDAMVDEYGAESERLEVQAERGAWVAKVELLEQQLATTKTELGAARRQHEPKLRRESSRADEAEAALAAAEAKAERAEVARRQMEAQLVRLSEGFNRQVEEVAELHTKVERARAAARGMVEKEVARSWIVNFVENTGRRGELLRLMASWWDFSEGDLLRCGLLDEPPPPVDVGPDAGITEQFAAFLDREGHSGDSPSHSPSASRPGSRRGSFS